MQARKTLIALLVFALLASPAAMLAQEEGESIFFASLSDASTWNPILSGDTGSSGAFQLLYLFTLPLDPFTGARSPGVLDSWEVSEDGLTYTFHVREDIVWSDGEPLDAYDVLFTYEATVSDLVDTPRKADFATVVGAEVIDDHTIAFTFSSPDCNALDGAAMYVVPAHRFAPDFSDVMTNSLNTEPDISNGPYLLEEWVPDDYQAFTANPDYSGGQWGAQTPANIERAFRRIIPDESTITQALKAEEIDWYQISALQWEDLLDTPHLNLFESEANQGIVFTAFNMADPAAGLVPGLDEDGNPIEQPPHPVFGDVRVRRALAMGWNKQAAIDAVIQGHGQPIYSTIAPSIGWAYNANLEPLPFDPDAAAALLEEAGWVDADGDGIREKDGVPLSFSLLTNAGNEIRESLGLLMQDDWRQIGVDARFEAIEFGTLVTERIYKQDYDAIIIGFTGGVPDPDGYARALLSVENDVENGFNMVSYYNPEFEEVLDLALNTPGCAYEDRAVHYARLQEIMWEDVPYDFIYNPFVLTAVHERVQGFDPELAWAPLSNLTEWEITP